MQKPMPYGFRWPCLSVLLRNWQMPLPGNVVICLPHDKEIFSLPQHTNNCVPLCLQIQLRADFLLALSFLTRIKKILSGFPDLQQIFFLCGENNNWVGDLSKPKIYSLVDDGKTISKTILFINYYFTYTLSRIYFIRIYLLE